MTTESAIRLLAGTLVTLGLVLGYYVSPWWQLLSLFVGLNLIQSVFTGICPAAMILEKLGMTHSCCGGGCCSEECDCSDEKCCSDEAKGEKGSSCC